MSIDLSGYSSIVFDCDGVILDSNRVKSEAFFTAALPYGEAAAMALVEHHVANGGVSRYAKFAYFLESIVPRYASEHICEGNRSALDALLSAYAESVSAGLMSCAIAKGLDELREATPKARWLIVSGGDQSELRNIFHKRQLDKYFNGGVFGSPDNKDLILAREKASSNICEPALFIGDSRYDHESASRAGIDFIFASYWTEMSNWKSYCETFKILSIPSMNVLHQRH